jgi:hypothetical protein
VQFAALEDPRQRMAHLFADAKLTLRRLNVRRRFGSALSRWHGCLARDGERLRA